MWPLYLAYDTDIRRRATQSPLDPSQFSIGIWNDLEARYTAKKVYTMVQADLVKQLPTQISGSTSSHTTRNPNHPTQPPSFRSQQHPLPDNPKLGRCIFCGDRSKSHTPRTCTANCYANGSPCHLYRHEPNGPRVSKSGKRYCFAWNGPSGCTQSSCRRGDHSCTLCGSPAHNAQQCDAIA
jgi:hypothetical protein